MSRINYDNLTRQRPDLADVWSFLSRWIAEHPAVPTVDIDRLAKAGNDVSPFKLAEALDFLRSEGIVHEVYQAKDPDGVLLGPEYETLADVPATVPDRFYSGYYDTRDLDVVPVFKLDDCAAHVSK